MSSPLIIFLHGVGSRGADLAPLADALAPYVPGASFAAPDGPEVFDMSAAGRQWFSVRGVTDANRPQRIVAARPAFDAVLARQMAEHGVTDQPGRVALLGFSQGAIMALDLLASGRLPVAAVAAFAGRLATPEPLVPSTATRLLIVHGSADPVMPVVESARAEERLAAAGVATERHVLAGVGHTITQQGVALAGQMLAGVFGAARTVH